MRTMDLTAKATDLNDRRATLVGSFDGYPMDAIRANVSCSLWQARKSARRTFQSLDDDKSDQPLLEFANQSQQITLLKHQPISECIFPRKLGP